MENKRVRLAEIDMARGISILFMVAGHTTLPFLMVEGYDSIPPELNSVLSVFRMPLFFIVSGYVFSSSKYIQKLNQLAIDRLWSLMLPYFTSALCFYVLWMINGKYPTVQNALKPLLGILYGNEPGGWLNMNAPLWFLCCLFMTQVLFGLLLRHVIHLPTWLQALIFALIGFLGQQIGQIVFLPWGLDIAMVAQFLLFVGYKLKEKRLLESVSRIHFHTIILIALFFAAAYYNSPIDINHRSYLNLILFYAGGICGSILVLQVSHIIAPFKPLAKGLSYMGRESLTILIFHLGFSFVMIHTVNKQLFPQNPFDWWVYMIGGVLLSLLAGAAIRRLPVIRVLFFGKNKSKVLTG